MKSKSVGVSKYTAIILLSGFLILVFLLLAILLFVVLNTESVKKDQYSQHYLYQEVLPSRNETKTGIVNLRKRLLEDEFLYWRKEQTSSTVIISAFADSDYECHGSCVCKVSNDGRRFTNVLSRGLFLMISALSAAMAIRIAEDFFATECLSNFKAACAEENIVSEVQSCSEKQEEDEDGAAEYQCVGHCKINKRISSPGALEALRDFEKEIGCDALFLVKSIRLDITEARRLQNVNQEAKRVFTRDLLIPYCKEASRRNYIWSSENNGQWTKKKDVAMCVGAGKGVTNNLGNVSCKKISLTV